MIDKPNIVDAHCDTLMRLIGPDAEADVLSQSLKGHLDLDRLLEAGVGLQFFALFTDPSLGESLGLRYVLEMIAHFNRSVAASEGRLYPVLTGADVAPRPGSVGGLLSIEGMHCLGESLELLEVLHELGVRSGMLTWNDRNALADGATRQDSGSGLSAAGRAFVQKMRQLHWVIDCSHLGDTSFWSLLEATDGPVIASHSNARAVRTHVRNLTDEQIQALAARGGVIGMNFAGMFLVEKPPAAIADVVQHIRHIADLVGPAHVGIGSDYDGIPEAPKGLETVAALPRLQDALSAEYSDAVVQGIMGDNFRRVLSASLA